MTKTDTSREAVERYFLVYSGTGVHIGTWVDGKIAADVLTEYLDGYIIETVPVAHAEKAEAERDTAWNDAIEAAASDLDLAAHIMSHHGGFTETEIYKMAAKKARALKKGEPT